jgi:hypothetical protein
MSHEEIDAALERVRVTNQLIGPAFANLLVAFGHPVRPVAHPIPPQSLEFAEHDARLTGHNTGGESPVGEDPTICATISRGRV